MKRFLKVFFALACCFGLGTVAKAENYQIDGSSIQIKSIPLGAVQNVTVPAETVTKETTAEPVPVIKNEVQEVIVKESAVQETTDQEPAVKDETVQQDTVQEEVYQYETYENYTKDDYYSEDYLQKVTRIGTSLLNKSGISVEVAFDVIETDDINAFATTDKEIYVLTGLLDYVANEEELAATISHEIGHIVNSHTTKQNAINNATNFAMENVKMDKNIQKGANMGKKVAMSKLSRTDEYEADITGVDLLYNAGYNPLAMVSLLYKISGNYVDILSTHPSGDKRTMYVYDYILYSYPEIAEKGYHTDAFKQFKEYADPIVGTRNATPEELSAFNEQQAKLREKRLAKLEDYKTRGQNSGWDNTYKIMNKATGLYNSKLKGKIK